MTRSLLGIGAVGALMLSFTSAPSSAADRGPPVAPNAGKPPVQRDDVPAPPMALLFGIGAVGVIWGRRLAAKARKIREQAESEQL